MVYTVTVNITGRHMKQIQLFRCFDVLFMLLFVLVQISKIYIGLIHNKFVHTTSDYMYTSNTLVTMSAIDRNVSPIWFVAQLTVVSVP